MWMTVYIQKVQQCLVEEHGFERGRNGSPQNVPDGFYEINISGRIDSVEIKDGRIHCCEYFAKEKGE